MGKVIQPLLGFNIVFNGRTLLKSKIFTIDSMTAK